jgi:hypothetical protein
MAVTTSEAAAVEAAFKEVYGDLDDQINKNVPVLELFENAGKEARWDGKAFIESVHTGRNHSTTAGGESTPVPLPGNQTYGEVNVPIKHVRSAIEITGVMFDKAKSDRAAFADITQKEIDGVLLDQRQKLERMICGDGRGVLALVDDDATGGETDLVVDSPGGVAGSIFGNRFIYPGQQLAFYAASPAAVLAYRVVSAVSEDGTTITIPSVDETEAPNNGLITPGVSYGSPDQAGSLGLEPMGLRGIVDDGTFVETLHGIDRSDPGNEFWKSSGPGFGAVGTLTEDILHRAENATHERSGIIPDTYLCHYSVHREYIKAGLGDRRFTGSDAHGADLGISGGSKNKPASLGFNGKTFHQCRYFDYGTLMCVDKGAMKRYKLQPGKWVDKDGSMWHRRERYEQFFAIYRLSCNYGTARPMSSFVLRGIDAIVDVNREAA